MTCCKLAAVPLFLLLTVTLACDRHALAPGEAESMRASAHAGSGLSLLDSEAFPSPGDAMVIADRAAGTFVVTLSRDQDRAYAHRIQAGSLVLISSTSTGDGPVKAAQVGDNFGVVDSFSNDLSVLKLDDAGNLSELSRTPRWREASKTAPRPWSRSPTGVNAVRPSTQSVVLRWSATYPNATSTGATHEVVRVITTAIRGR